MRHAKTIMRFRRIEVESPHYLDIYIHNAKNAATHSLLHHDFFGPVDHFINEILGDSELAERDLELRW
jgi:hypothetical protein